MEELCEHGTKPKNHLICKYETLHSLPASIILQKKSKLIHKSPTSTACFWIRDHSVLHNSQTEVFYLQGFLSKLIILNSCRWWEKEKRSFLLRILQRNNWIYEIMDGNFLPPVAWRNILQQMKFVWAQPAGSRWKYMGYIWISEKKKHPQTSLESKEASSRNCSCSINVN